MRSRPRRRSRRRFIAGGKALLEGCGLVHTAKRIAVSHLPQATAIGRERLVEIAQAVDLACAALSGLFADGHEIVAPDGASTRGDGAGRALRAVEGIARHTGFRRDVRRDHLEHVELRGHLEERVCVLRFFVEGACLARDVADAKRSFRDCRGAPAQVLQRRCLECADPPGRTIDARFEAVAGPHPATPRQTRTDPRTTPSASLPG